MTTLAASAFFIALVAPIFALSGLLWSIRFRRRYGLRPLVLCVGLMLVSLAFNPLIQVSLLESLDTSRGIGLGRMASAASIVGKTKDQVRELFGDPSNVRTDDPEVVIWEYKQLPIYWLGSYFQVFFRGGTVVGFEPNDD